MNDIIEQNQAAAKSNLRTGKLDRRNQWDTHPIIGDRRAGQRRSAVSTLEQAALLRPAKPAPFEVCEYMPSIPDRIGLVIGGLCAQYQRVTWYEAGGKVKVKGWQSCKTGVTFVTFYRGVDDFKTRLARLLNNR